jgi:hypothetical protein
MVQLDNSFFQMNTLADSEHFDDMSASASRVAQYTSSTTSHLPVNWREIKADIRNITERSKLAAYILEHDGELAQYTTALLNTWMAVEGCKFTRRHDQLCVSKICEMRYRSLTQLSAEVDAIKTELAEIKNAVVQLGASFGELHKFVHSCIRVER